MSGMRGRISGRVCPPRFSSLSGVYEVGDVLLMVRRVWIDMVEAEEQRLKAREDAAHEQEKRDMESGKFKPKEKEHHDEGKKAHKKEEKMDDHREKE